MCLQWDVMTNKELGTTVSTSLQQMLPACPSGTSCMEQVKCIFSALKGYSLFFHKFFSDSIFTKVLDFSVFFL